MLHGILERSLHGPTVSFESYRKGVTTNSKISRGSVYDASANDYTVPDLVATGIGGK